MKRAAPLHNVYYNLENTKIGRCVYAPLVLEEKDENRGAEYFCKVGRCRVYTLRIRAGHVIEVGSCLASTVANEMVISFS